jgi:peptidyl-prolyl cis-trans isomerase C
MKRYLMTLSVVGVVACGGKKETPAPATPEPVATNPTPAPAADAAAPAPTDPAKPAERERITGPVAKVNGVEIPSTVFYEELDKITARGAQIPPDRVARIEQNILKRLVEQELINQAVKEAAVVVPEEDLKKGFDEYKQRFQSEEQFDNYLKHGRVTKESIEQRIRERRSLELLLEKKGEMTVTDAEAQDFYAKNERFYTEKAGIRASHVLIKLPENATPEDDAKAMEKVKLAQERIKKGEDFDKIATEMSEGPAANKGGDLGFFSQGRMVKEFEDVAFKMKVGEISDPVKTRFGYHIIKLTDRREDRKKPFEEVKDQIVKSLQNKKFFTERRKLLADLEKAAKIEKFIAEPPPEAPGATEHLGPGDHKPGDGHDHGANDGHDHGKPAPMPAPGGEVPAPGAPTPVPVPAPGAPTPAPAPGAPTPAPAPQ